MTAPTATPETPEQWEEMVQTVLATPESAQEAINNGNLAKYMAGYGNAFRSQQNKTMKDLAGQLTDQVSASVMEMFKRNGVETDGRPDLRPEAVKAVNAGTAYNRDAAGADPKLAAIWGNGMRAGAQMIQDLLTNKQGRATAEARARLESYEALTNLSPHIPAEGGILLTEEVRSEIMTRALDAAVVRPQATVVPIPTGKFRWPVNDMTTEVGEVYGGIAMAWLDAGETFPEVNAAFGALSLEAHKLGGLASVPNEMIRFIAALETWLRTNLPNAVREFEDRAYMKGNGVGKPLGGLSAGNPALLIVAKESGQTAATITWNNILAMYARLLPESFGKAEWDITPDALPEIFSMALPVGTGGSAVMLGEGAGPNRLAQTILGLPIRWTRKAPGVKGTQGDISLVDWSNYVIGDAVNVQLDTSEHSSFRSDKTDLRVLTHVDGQPGMLSPLTPENNGPTLSAYVQLATRS